MYGASLAIASRVYEQYDKDYAKKFKTKMLKLFGNIQKKILNQFIVLMKDKKMVQAHIIKIQILKNVYGQLQKMFRTTGDAKYESYLKKESKRLTDKPSFFTWDDTLALAQFCIC